MIGKKKAKNVDDVQENVLHMVVIFDTVSEQSGNIMLLPTLKLVDRFIKSNIKAFADEFVLYHLGTFNQKTLQFDIFKKPFALRSGAEIKSIVEVPADGEKTS